MHIYIHNQKIIYKYKKIYEYAYIRTISDMCILTKFTYI